MAPVRRYLRVSRSTVLEVRIHMDNPADTQRWLLHPREPALQRVIAAIRPLIVPKLREENERARKGKKKQPVKDVVAGGKFPRDEHAQFHDLLTRPKDDFEVTVLFVEGGTPHSVLKRHKTFVTKKQDAEGNGSQAVPVEVADDEDDDDDEERAPGLVREESDEADGVKLEDIPSHDAAMNDHGATADSPAAVSDDEDEDRDLSNNPETNQDEKKKMGMLATYEGFRIHGYTLYLVVKRTDAGTIARDGGPEHSLMEGWITSTQAVPAVVDD